MALTLSEIEILVRFYTGNDTISLSVDPGLSVFNKNYRRLAMSYKWPEFRSTVSSGDVVTSSSVNQYNWPFYNLINEGDSSITTYENNYDEGDSSVTTYRYSFDDGDSRVGIVRFIDVVSLEVENSATSGEFELQLVPPSEVDWNEASYDSASIPDYYIRYDDSGTAKFELRPSPSYNGGKIKITGYTEPFELTGPSQTTEFITKTADEALARLVASDYFLVTGDVGESEKQVRKVRNVLHYLKEEVVPAERIGDKPFKKK